MSDESETQASAFYCDDTPNPPQIKSVEIRHRIIHDKRVWVPMDEYRAQIAALTAERDAAKAAAARVKPLEWRDSYGVLRAESPFGDYKVAGKILYHPNSLAVQSVHDSAEAAQAAAQADYESRILAALDPAPVSDEALIRAGRWSLGALSVRVCAWRAKRVAFTAP